ncbi:MAG TPA: hypothetical protein VFJ94_13555 [Intrasporangium sp.]|uniref:hypothetical protein n=1 Tax=Intrasporangium sp. TaxID=1925024 RepID=UPI002D7904B7|nr:hypothetical protein [Intrasporangium sp.]HET7399538.1 hypothetical protein [Intrasporangium sp.]
MSLRHVRAVSAVLLVSTFAVVTAGPAGASLTATVADLVLPATPYSHRAQTTSGRLVLTAADSTSVCTPPGSGVGSGAGWHVSEQASDLTYTGPNHGADIAAAKLAIVSVEEPVVVAGMPVDPVGGPRVPHTSPVGSLDSPRTVLSAEPGYGCGTYRQGITLELSIPPRARAGTYTATITTTIAAGP